MDKYSINQLFARFSAADPEPKGELKFGSNFELLVAVILSAQATDVSVNKATRTLFREANTPAQILELGEAKLIEHIKSIGLYRNKAKNILVTCSMLLNRFGGQVPSDREALQSLAGVGRKTANVVLNIGFGQATIAVDTHIFRLSNRMGLAPGRNVNAVESTLEQCIPQMYLRHAHHWLILHGRYVCKARNPNCSQCLVGDLCEYEEKAAGKD